MCAVAIVVIVLFVVGAVILVASPFSGSFQSAAAGVLGGLGMMASQVFVGSVLTLITIALVNGLVWYGRLHFRLLKPAIDPKPPTAPAELTLP
jgi:uncharacterized membrane protein